MTQLYNKSQNLIYLKRSRLKILIKILFAQNLNVVLLTYNYLMKPQSDSNSGARLELKKIIKPKENPPQQSTLKSIVESESKPKDNKDKKVKFDEKQSKDKKQKNKDEKEKDDQKASKSKDKKDKKDKEDKKGKKDKKEEKKDKKKAQKQSKLSKSGSKSKSKMKIKDLMNDEGELQTINSIIKQQRKAKLTIQQLIEQYKQQAQRLLFLNKGHDPQKQRQIHKQILVHQRQKQKRHKRIQQIQKHHEKMIQSKEKAREAKIQLKKQKIRERKIKRVEQKLSALEISAEQRKRDYQKFIEYVKERKKFKPRFKRYDQQYQQYLKEENDDYRDKLDELARKYEPMNKLELASFEENYLAQRQQGVQYRQNKLKLEQQLIKEENQRREKLLWKGHCHENTKDQIKKHLQRKHAPWQKQQVIKQYSKFVSENMKKKRQEVGQDQDKNEQEEVQPPDQKIAYHQKYLKGVNYGLVPYQKPAPLPLEEVHKKGNSYLEQTIQQNKNKKNKTVDYTNSMDSSRKLSASQDLKKDLRTFRLRKKSNPYYASESPKISIDFKNYQAIEFSLQKLNAIKKDRELNDQIIKHGEYDSILAIQERKRKAGNLVVKEINEKLNILKKL